MRLQKGATCRLGKLVSGGDTAGEYGASATASLGVEYTMTTTILAAIGSVLQYPLFLPCIANMHISGLFHASHQPPV